MTPVQVYRPGILREGPDRYISSNCNPPNTLGLSHKLGIGINTDVQTRRQTSDACLPSTELAAVAQSNCSVSEVCSCLSTKMSAFIFASLSGNYAQFSIFEHQETRQTSILMSPSVSVQGPAPRKTHSPTFTDYVRILPMLDAKRSTDTSRSSSATLSFCNRELRMQPQGDADN